MDRVEHAIRRRQDLAAFREEAQVVLAEAQYRGDGAWFATELGRLEAETRRRVQAEVAINYLRSP